MVTMVVELWRKTLCALVGHVPVGRGPAWNVTVPTRCARLNGTVDRGEVTFAVRAAWCARCDEALDEYTDGGEP